jgi:glycerol uptake operon antiterminator
MNLEGKPIIAAVRDKDSFFAACNSGCEVIFLLSANVLELESLARTAHAKQKKLFLHIDLAEGVGKDSYGVRHVAALGIDGIVSTRVSMIRAARECGMECVQRFFMVDSRSIDTALEAIRNAKPDMIEIMPGITTKAITRLSGHVSVPIIAGGLLDDQREIDAAFAAGAAAVSTGTADLWN